MSRRYTKPRRVPQWHLVQRPGGWLLRLVGTNGEQVLGSKVYTDKRQAERALRIARTSRSRVVEVDERDGSRAAAGGAW